ncbi:MAG: hypothetical protein OEM52_04185, partial [bacterium]|nr:hypothetical protein [bacterium]
TWFCSDNQSNTNIVRLGRSNAPFSYYLLCNRIMMSRGLSNFLIALELRIILQWERIYEME